MKQSIIFLCVGLLFFAVGLEANILPIVNTTSICTSKIPCVLTWVEDGIAPKLLDLPPVNIKLMTGPNQNQIEVQDLGTVSAAKGKIAFNISPTLGPPGKFYFYKFKAGDNEPIWSSRFTIQDIDGKIPGFDPKTVNAQGDIVAEPSPSDSATPMAMATATATASNTSSAEASQSNTASSILSINVATTIGMTVIAAVYFC